LFFILSKTAGFFSLPSNDLFCIGLLGAILLRTRLARAGRRLLVVCVIGLLVFGLLPTSVLLILPLEQRFPAWDPARGAPDGIIVLGGALDPDISAARSATAINDAAERLIVVPELARRYPKARILFSGGNASVLEHGLSEAQFAVPLIESLGVAHDRILVEGRSRNTAENAAFSKALAAPKPGERWLLVTSAFHMPRAIGCFRQAGFEVEAYPVDWRTRGPRDLIDISNVGGGLANTDLATHEWIGLVVYWLTGRTPVLFPGPSR